MHLDKVNAYVTTLCINKMDISICVNLFIFFALYFWSRFHSCPKRKCFWCPFSLSFHWCFHSIHHFCCLPFLCATLPLLQASSHLSSPLPTSAYVFLGMHKKQCIIFSWLQPPQSAPAHRSQCPQTVFPSVLGGQPAGQVHIPTQTRGVRPHLRQK